MLDARVQGLRSALPEDFEAALVQTETSRFYLLDFDSGDAGTLLLFPDELVFVVDSRYIESAQAQVRHACVVLEQDALAQVANLLAQRGVKRLLLENQISVAQARRVRDALPGVEVDDGPLLGRALAARRAVKDAEEIRRIRQAQGIADACFTHILPFIREGVQERELVLEMEYFMRRQGAEKVAFDTICVAGPNSSLPHGVPGEYRVRPGDFITLDFGARCGGYCSDMTRTVALGEPGGEKRRVYAAVLRAHLAGIQAARGGRKGSEVDGAARQILDSEGYGAYFGHGLGHGVGIEIHEEPRFSPKCHDVVCPGMVMTVEPGCYLPGRFGCRIEDMVLIGEDGCEPLAASDKSLIVL